MTSLSQQSAFVTRRRVLVGLVAVIFAVVGWWLLAYPRGMLGASFDNARGHYEIQVFGKPPPWESELARLLQTRYGVEIKSVAACIVTDQLVNYIEGYNAVSRSRIETRLGKDVFAECAREARTTWEREHPNK